MLDSEVVVSGEQTRGALALGDPMFCSHNEVDLEPKVVRLADGLDWVVVHCTACEGRIGKRYLLSDMVRETARQHYEDE